ncbi:MAG: DNA-directed RNA polymerase subunit alpha [Flavobacteriales bacterium]|nr:DNA-directed RNA polymerase subunit alpha [Flavobacteriales bacterium]MDG1426259.1 DNA-directed RNA polymerase subunit alpha [Flavobacteriales bacterium]MDG2086604.1 DNA-directed RNA polymerase subunit alpha [Flavobacteriales bacterium]|tara:strand:+ start:1927 stop:2898 length:972 start_codon:yes stop_codon:yes gene_type:complete
MSILNFQKPDEVIMINEEANQGNFEFRPLEPGYGLTVGNALRRVLLSSLEGFAITSIKITGVDHEFSTIEGVVQDIAEIILNIKQVRFKQQIDSVESEVATLKVTKSDNVTASDIASSLSNFQVLNTDQVICEMNKSVTFEMEFTISKGRGYVPADENVDEDASIGTIAIDSIFTPIKNVNYNIENYRVGQKTDFEKLNFNITTDGSIEPKNALTEASKILIQHFMLFSDEKINLEEEVVDDFDEDTLHMRQLLKTELTEFGLSVRALNCLKTAEVFTLGELVSFKKSDMLKFRNFGKKSLTELEDLVSEKGLTFGFDVEKYN